MADLIVVTENDLVTVFEGAGPAVVDIFQGIGTSGLVPDPGTGTSTRVMLADGTWAEQSGGGGGGGAPTDAPYITAALHAGLSAERVLGGEASIVEIDLATAGQANVKLIAGGVSNAKLANVPTATLKGRTAAGTGVPTDLTAAQVRAILNVEDGATADQIASEVPYSNATSGLAATNLQAAVDELDGLLDALGNGMVFQGSFDAGGGAGPVNFPGGGTAQAGAFYVVINAAAGGTTVGTANPIIVHTGDDLVARQDNASTTDGAQWVKLDSTDAVSSVSGRVGAVVLEPSDLTNVTTDRLVGRDSAGTGVAEQISVGNGLEFDGAGGIRRSALTGDVGAAAGSNSLSITGAAVTNAKLADMVQSTIKGRAAAGGTGSPVDLTVDQVKTIIGVFAQDITGLVTAPSAADIAANRVLRADGAWADQTGGGGGAPVDGTYLVQTLNGTLSAERVLSGESGVVTVDYGTPSEAHVNIDALGITAAKLAANAVTTAKILDANVTLAKIANIATDRLLGRDTGSSGVVEELTVGGGVEFTGTGGIQRSALAGDVTADAGSGATVLVQGSSSFAFTGDITPATLTADADDYNPTGLSTAAVLRLTSNASRTIRGLAGGADGRIVILVNVGSNDIILADESSTTLSMRFALDGSRKIAPDEAAILIYDATASRWREIGGRLTELFGDVTGSGAGAVDTVIAANAVTTAKILDANVTNAKLANMATQTIKGRTTAGTGVPEDLTAAQVRTILNVEDGATADQNAAEVPYSNATSGMAATNVQAAIDEIDGLLDALGNGMVFKGDVDFAGSGTGSFPGSGAAQAGWFYVVINAAAGGTVVGSSNSITVHTGDQLVARVDNASATDGADWVKLDSTDAVSAVAGKTGSVTLEPSDLTNVTTARLIGRTTAGTGAAEQLSKASVLTFLNVQDGATDDQTAAEILAALLTVDGSGSGLDADFLDGQSSAAFAAASHSHAISDVTGLQTALDGKLANVVEDTTPQLGGQLDVNGQALGDGTRELLTFIEDGSAVNQLEIENQAAGGGPILRATGDDTDVDLHLDCKGAGAVIVDADETVNGNIVVTGTVDGRDIAADGTKLDGIEAGAIAPPFVEADLANNAVTDAKFRQSAALSLVGRTQNSVGNVADIVATVTGHVPRVAGGLLEFGQLATVSYLASSVTYAKIQNVSSNLRVLGRISVGAGDIEELTGANLRTIIAAGGGPFAPFSAHPVDAGFVYSALYTGGGANSKHEWGYGVTDATTLTADGTWRLRFEVPGVLPTGTCKLRIISLANATTGDLKVNPKWASVAMEESPSGATLDTTTGTQTITWGAGDNDQYKETKIALVGDTVVAGEIIVMDLVFENTGTTLAVESVHQFSIMWE